MKLNPLSLNSPSQVHKAQNNKNAEAVRLKPLGRDTVSFGSCEKGIDFNLQKLTDRLEINDLAIKELDLAKAQKIIKQKELIMLRNGIQNDSSDVGILRVFGSKVKENQDGTLSISGFKNIRAGLSFKDLGIDGDKVFSRVKTVEDDLNLYGTNVRYLDNLEVVKGRFSSSATLEKADKLRFFEEGSFNYSKISDFPALEDVKTKIVLNPEQRKALGAKLEAFPSKPAIEVF